MDSWTVVGGSGRASKPVKPNANAAPTKDSKSPSPGHTLTQSAAREELPGWDPETNCSKRDKSKSRSSGRAQLPTQQPVAPDDQVQIADDCEAALVDQQQSTASRLPTHRNRRGARACIATTPEQQVARLVSQVEECRWACMLTE